MDNENKNQYFMNIGERKPGFQSLPSRTKNIRVGVKTWDTLKRLKKEDETFDDVIKELIDKRTKEIGDENIKAIRFERKLMFFTTEPFLNKEVGFEFEYNDVKGKKDDFTLDLKLKKVFFRRKVLNPSEFFGVDNIHKHFSDLFLSVYFRSITFALKREFKIHFPHHNTQERFENIALWRQFYYEYSLSQDSFREDIEEPLRLSEDEKIPKEWKERVENSIANKFLYDK